MKIRCSGIRSLAMGSLIASLTLVAASSSAFAQDGPPPGAGGPPVGGPPGGGRGGAGGPGGQGAPDPQQFVDRLMANDANGDGKLSKDEIPGGLGDRLFEQGDANKDGFLTPDELKAVAGRVGGGGRQGGQQVSFGGYMNQAGRAIRGLEKSKFDESSRETDLQAISAIEAGLAGAKARLNTVPMSPKAKEKYGSDEAAYHKDMRKHLMTAIYASLELETALIEGQSDVAQKCFAKLTQLEEDSHELFQPPEDERGPGQQPPPPGGGAGGGGRNGAGARGGNGGGGGGGGGQN